MAQINKVQAAKTTQKHEQIQVDRNGMNIRLKTESQHVFKAT